MKKPLITLVCLMAFIAALADNNYFTMGVNDTVYINPYTMINGDSLAVKANFSGRLDRWDLTFTYPDGMEARRVSARSDMTLHYMNIDREESILNAPLTAEYNNTKISTQIWEMGYYEFLGQWMAYGTVKWEAGFYGRMFDIGFWFDQGFTGGTILIDGILRSGVDYRGGTISAPDTICRSVEVIVGYMRGDVNGDGSLTSADLTELINYLLDPEGAGWDQYQIAAGDVNGSGSITIADVSALANLMLSQG